MPSVTQTTSKFDAADLKFAFCPLLLMMAFMILTKSSTPTSQTVCNWGGQLWAFNDNKRNSNGKPVQWRGLDMCVDLVHLTWSWHLSSRTKNQTFFHTHHEMGGKLLACNIAERHENGDPVWCRGLDMCVDLVHLIWSWHSWFISNKDVILTCF